MLLFLWEGPSLHLGTAFQRVRRGKRRGKEVPEVATSPAHILLTRVFLTAGEIGKCSLIKGSCVQLTILVL